MLKQLYVLMMRLNCWPCLKKKTKRFLGNFHRGNGKVSIGVVTVVMSLVEYRVKSMASSLYLNL